MTYTILTNDEFDANEKQDKLDLDLFRKIVNRTPKKMHLIYKLLDKGANPMRFDGKIIECSFNHTGFDSNYLEFFTYCYENYDVVKTYVHDKLNLTMALTEPVRHINAVLFLINHTERNLTQKERERLNNPPVNLKVGNEYAIKQINQALDKKDLFGKLTDKHQAQPIKTKTPTQKMKI